MSEFNIEVEGGSRVRLLTGGKYCPEDIIVTAKGGAGGGESVFDKYVAGETTEIESAATKIVANAFYSNQIITSASFPNATTVGKSAFNRALALTNLHLPKATVLNESALASCNKLVGVELPNVRTVYRYVFQYCELLESIDCHQLTYIAAYAFQYCYSLKSVIIRSETVCSLVNKNAFEYCSHFTSTKDGYIYVPANLVDSYKADTNWSSYASQIRAIPGEESTKLPTPTIMVDIGDLYINDYGNATSATLYWSGGGVSWDVLTDFDLTTGENQHVISYDALVSWLDEYAGVVAGDGSVYLSVITHADGYEDSERSNSDILAL